MLKEKRAQYVSFNVPFEAERLSAIVQRIICENKTASDKSSITINITVGCIQHICSHSAETRSGSGVRREVIIGIFQGIREGVAKKSV